MGRLSNKPSQLNWFRHLHVFAVRQRKLEPQDGQDARVQCRHSRNREGATVVTVRLQTVDSVIGLNGSSKASCQLGKASVGSRGQPAEQKLPSLRWRNFFDQVPKPLNDTVLLPAAREGRRSGTPYQPYL